MSKSVLLWAKGTNKTRGKLKLMRLRRELERGKRSARRRTNRSSASGKKLAFSTSKRKLPADVPSKKLNVKKLKKPKKLNKKTLCAGSKNLRLDSCYATNKKNLFVSSSSS